MAAFLNNFSSYGLFTPRLRSLPSATCVRPTSFFRMSQSRADVSKTMGKVPAGKDPKTMSDTDWRSVLTREEFNIIRQKGTEYPGSGEYDGFYPKEGHFVCRACGNPIYSAESKFKSGCGWPAFDKCYKGSVSIERDASLGMMRVEIMCARCGGHLGHVFEGERFTQSNERHCVNSASLKYVAGTLDQEEAKVL